MNQQFFDQLNIPTPFIDLEVGSGSHANQTAQVMIKFEEYLMAHQPDIVIVFGDVNSTLACAITAKKLHIKVAHVESGLRSRDMKMPEEINRLVTDAISDILYTPSEDANDNLIREGKSKESIEFVGNIMIDTLFSQKQKADETKFFQSLQLSQNEYVLLTLHRPSNVDEKDTFESILSAVKIIAEEKTVVFPAHPRTLQKINDLGLSNYFNLNGVISNKINVIEPLGYHEMMNLLSHTYCVLTDSGGIQEESTALNVPCLTLRESTERPITVSEGTNQVVGVNSQAIQDAFSRIQRNNNEIKNPVYWDGKTSQRIVSHLKVTLFK
jgi:UDP-N-acetylglucosamine 2-epimerase (non-hydrolysing)